MPDYIKFEKNIKVPDMGQYVVVKITGQGRGKIPKVENYVVSELGERQILLPFLMSMKAQMLILYLRQPTQQVPFLSHLSRNKLSTVGPMVNQITVKIKNLKPPSTSMVAFSIMSP